MKNLPEKLKIYKKVKVNFPFQNLFILKNQIFIKIKI